MKRELLNVQQAASFLGVNPATIRRWAKTQQLLAVRIGSRGDWRFTEEDLHQMINKDTNRMESKQATSTVVYTDLSDSKQAGMAIGTDILKQLNNISPDVVIVFSSSKHNYSQLLKAIKKTCGPKLLVGSSSAGEFISNTHGEGSVSAIAFRNDEMQFHVGIGKNISKNPDQAARTVISSFKGMDNQTYPYRSGLILADALAGHTDALIDQMNLLTAGTYQFFGGGAGDDAKFKKTHVFLNTEAFTNAVVGLEILSKKPLGIGVRHGWEEASVPMRVTEADGMKLISLNAIPAVEAFKEHAKATGQTFNTSDPIPFFLHNVIGIKTVNGYKLRVPLALNEDGSILCASDIPSGTVVSIMKTTANSAASAAKEATADAVRQTQSKGSGVAIVFDCVATRLRTGKEFNTELESVASALGNIKFVGCNTYGQIARVDGQFNGFHNCTAVVCVIPD